MSDKQIVQTQDIFSVLNELNVNDHVEKKSTGKVELSYLSWVWAWQEVRKRYPDATYDIIKNESGLPYFADPALGIMVYTTVTINNETHMMWLPVMDGANNAMKLEPYSFETKFGTKTVQAATMFDVNKTIMRCLVKNLAMFGLGLYIYAGEDLPEESDDVKNAREEERKQREQHIRDVINEIDAEVKRITKTMSSDEKKTFANDMIVPVIGQVNYKTCKDVEKLDDLFKKMKVA